MSRSSGSKVVGPCPYCGQRYRLTNWMRRSGDDVRRDSSGRLLDNTHLIACHDRATTQPEDAE